MTPSLAADVVEGRARPTPSRFCAVAEGSAVVPPCDMSDGCGDAERLSSSSFEKLGKTHAATSVWSMNEKGPLASEEVEGV